MTHTPKSAEPTSAPWTWRGLPLWLPALLLVLGWLVGYGPGVGLSDHSYGGPPKWDAGPYIWFLWHLKDALFGPGELWHSDLLFFPGGLAMINQDWTPLPGLLALPLQVFGPIVAYNLQFLLAYALTGCATYWLARVLGASRPHALLAAIIFTFCEFRVLKAHYHGQPGHAHQELIPLYLGLLWRYLRPGGRTRHALLAGLCFFGAAFTTPYQFVFLALFSLLLLAAHLLAALPTPAGAAGADPGRGRRLVRALGREGRFLLWGGGTALLLVAPLLLWQWDALVQGAGVLGDSGMRHPADLLSYTGSALFRQPTRFFHYNESWSAWQGYSVMALSLVVLLAAPRRSGARLWLLFGLAFFLLSLGDALTIDGKARVELPFFALLEATPILQGVRFASRFSSMLTLCLGLAIALGLSALERRRLAACPLHRRRLLQGALLLLVTGELVGGPARLALAGRTRHELVPCPPCRIMAADPRPGTLITYPLIWETRNRTWGPHLFPRQLLPRQTVHRKRLVTGLGDAIPDATIEAYLADPLLGALFGLQQRGEAPAVDPAARAAARAAVRRLGVRYFELFKNPRSLSPLPFGGTYHTELARAYLQRLLPLKPLYEDPERVLFALESAP